MARLHVFIFILLLSSIISGEVWGFPKQMDKSIDETMLEKSSKIEAPSVSFEDELAIVYRILERVPLIDGFVTLDEWTEQNNSLLLILAIMICLMLFEKLPTTNWLVSI